MRVYVQGRSVCLFTIDNRLDRVGKDVLLWCVGPKDLVECVAARGFLALEGRVKERKRCVRV